MPDPTDAKRALRRTMRAVRRDLPEQAERSARIRERLESLPEVAAARVVMVFDPVQGEPLVGPFVEWCREQGKAVVVPDSDPAAEPPPDADRFDVVVVPGLAFTIAGDRLGQGGGWYDRFLAAVRPDCLTIGVGFAPQLVDELPVERHDVRLGLVVTDMTA